MDERPMGLKILTALYFLGGAFCLVVATLILISGKEGDLVWGAGSGVLAFVLLALSWGLWRLRDRARRMTLLVTLLAIPAQLGLAASFIAGTDPQLPQRFNDLVGAARQSDTTPILGLSTLVGAGMNVVAGWYLARQPVRRVFQSSNPTTESLATKTSGTIVAAHYARALPGGVAQAPSDSLKSDPSAPAWLVARSGPLTGQQFPLTRERNTVGRDTVRASIKVDDPQVSRQHAQFNFERGHVFLYDLASTNGTFVNNQRVRKQRLSDGDEVRVGQTVFVFRQTH